jgi:hypothetical protein
VEIAYTPWWCDRQLSSAGALPVPATQACIGPLIAKFSAASAGLSSSRTGRNRQHNCFPSALCYRSDVSCICCAGWFAVYSLAPPANVAEYVHRAGRTGRIGNQSTSSTVTTFASPELGEEAPRRARWVTR